MILASGLDVVRQGTDVLDRSARTIAGATGDATRTPADVVAAVLDLSAARLLVGSGARLVETARETDRRLLDVLA